MLKHIIFDLGAVLYDIDYQLTANEFKALGVQNFDALYSQFHANELFTNLETGKITATEFYRSIAPYCSKGTTDAEIRTAWNAMLLGFRQTSIRYLPALATKYELYVLSNTNQIHYQQVEADYLQQFGNSNFKTLFKKCWLSYEIGYRKPDQEVFEYIITNAALEPQECLFIDDTNINVDAGNAAGIPSVLLKQGDFIEDIAYHDFTSS